MTAPTVPTALTICTEAIKKAGHSVPSSSQLTRAYDWLEEIKNDIWMLEKKLTPLMAEHVEVLTAGYGRYNLPSGCSCVLNAKLLIGDEVNDVTGTAAATVTLDTSDETGTEDDIEGSEILIYSGTGKGSMSRCSSYDETTYIASVSPAWAVAVGGVAPIITDTYMIVDQYEPIEIQNVTYFDENNKVSIGAPDTMYIVGNDTHYGYYHLNPIPNDDNDNYYALKFNYFINLLTLDLASARMTTLYQRWRNLWIQGIKAKQLENDDDARADAELQKYLAMVRDITKLEKYGRGLKAFINRVSA